jgi:type II secretion system protein N
MPDFVQALLSPDFWRSHLRAICYGGLGLLLFLLFLAASFPYGDALASLLAPFNLALTYTDHRARLPIGAELDGVQLTSTLAPGAPPLLDGANVTLAPTLGSLLLVRPGVHLKAELYGGFLSLVLYRIRNGVGVGIDASSLDLSRYRKLVQMGVNLRGFLTGTASASLPGVDPMRGDGQVHLEISHCSLRVMRGFPTLQLGNLDGSAHLEDGTLTVDALHGSGGDLTVSATGTIQLAPDLPDSQVDLRVKLEPTAQGRQHLGAMLQLLPHPPGAQPYVIRGRLAAPAIS